MMSLRVIGYQDGHRVVVEEGPARARPQGYGGHALGYFSGTRIVTKQQNVDDTVRRTPENQGVKPTESRRFRP